MVAGNIWDIVVEIAVVVGVEVVVAVVVVALLGY